jgi:hypothetical protein
MLRQALLPIVPFIEAWRVLATFWLEEVLHKDKEFILARAEEMKEEKGCSKDDMAKERASRTMGNEGWGRKEEECGFSRATGSVL